MDWPWKALAAVDRRRQYLALPSYLPLRKYHEIPRFLPFTRQMQRQFRSTPGAIGYCMPAKLLCRQFWTLRFGKMSVLSLRSGARRNSPQGKSGFGQPFRGERGHPARVTGELNYGGCDSQGLSGRQERR
jgi:hypothetical protein